MLNASKNCREGTRKAFQKENNFALSPSDSEMNKYEDTTLISVSVRVAN